MSSLKFLPIIPKKDAYWNAMPTNSSKNVDAYLITILIFQLHGIGLLTVITQDYNAYPN